MKLLGVLATAILVALLLAGCTGTNPATGPGTPLSAPRTDAFAPPTTPAQAPDGFGSEPSILVARDGALYFTSVLGSATARGDGLWKTTDNGTTWSYLGKADYPFGGGDSDLDEFANGRLLLTGQWRPAAAPANPVASPYVTGGESVSYSTDGGKSWTPSPAAGYLPDADRNWLAIAGPQTAYLVYNDAATGLMVGTTTDGGATWQPAVPVPGTGSAGGPTTPAVGGANGIAGDAVVDSRGHLWIPYGPGPGGGTVQRVEEGIPGTTGLSFAEHLVRTTPADRTSGAIFSTIAVDPQDNLYFAWVESVAGPAAPIDTKPSSPMQAFLATSTDHGATWSKPFMVSQPSTPPHTTAPLQRPTTVVFPWVVAAAPGKVAVSFYGGNATVGSDDAPATTTWYPYVAFVRGALSGNATVSVVQASAVPNHHGPICTGGTGCSSGRTLGDFFEMGLDKWGRVALVYADDTGPAQSNHVVVQASGSLLP